SYRSRANRHPHSFPTRRSSDLEVVGDQRIGRKVEAQRRVPRLVQLQQQPAADDAGKAGSLRDRQRDVAAVAEQHGLGMEEVEAADRKSTRLNSSHLVISYAVFC